MFKLIGLISAAVIILALFGGYFALRTRQAQLTASESRHNLSEETAATAAAAAAAPIKLRVFENEAYLKNSQVVLGGTLENISAEGLTGLTVTIRLMNRNTDAEDLKTVTPAPADLAPGARASYSLTVPSGKWSGAKVVRVASASSENSANSEADVAFQSSRGNLRPREQQPAAQVRTVIVNRPPRPKGKGEEFLNTPDNPVIIK